MVCHYERKEVLAWKIILQRKASFAQATSQEVIQKLSD
jgi:hypothetical protein